MSGIVWVEQAVVLALHEEHLAEHGGPTGLRDPGLLESALFRPRHTAIYETPDVAALAAAYGFGIARNHPFVDGNKRTAFTVTELFLALMRLSTRSWAKRPPRIAGSPLSCTHCPGC